MIPHAARVAGRPARGVDYGFRSVVTAAWRISATVGGAACCASSHMTMTGEIPRTSRDTVVEIFASATTLTPTSTRTIDNQPPITNKRENVLLFDTIIPLGVLVRPSNFHAVDWTHLPAGERLEHLVSIEHHAPRRETDLRAPLRERPGS